MTASLRLIEPQEIYSSSTTQRLPKNRFGGLSPDLLKKVISLLTEESFKKGESIIAEGDSFKNVYLIRSGYVKISTFNLQKEEVFLTVQGANETLGEFAVYNENRYPISATAITDLKVWKLPAQDFITLRNENAEFCGKAADYLFLRTQRLKRRLAQIASETVEERLKQFFLNLLKEFQIQENLESTLPFYLTRKELAQAVYTTQETATRIMNKWQKEGKVLSEKEKFTFHASFFDYDPGFNVCRDTNASNTVRLLGQNSIHLAFE